MTDSQTQQVIHALEQKISGEYRSEIEKLCEPDKCS